MGEPSAAMQPATRNSEQRSNPRFDVDERATVFLVDQGASLSCQLLDLSLGGCRVQTRERIVAGAGVRVELGFRVRGYSFRICGMTRWISRRNQAGIKFLEMSERRRADLAEILGELEEAARAKAEKEAAERSAAAAGLAEKVTREPDAVLASIAGQVQADAPWPPQEEKAAAPEPEPPAPEASPAAPQRPPMLWPAAEPGARPIRGPLEGSGGTGYRVLVLSKPVPAAGPSATSLSAAARPAPRPAPRERRTELRHGLDTQAVIFLIRIGSALEGRILDLSLSGCRIRTVERFPVGIYTRVEVEFRLEGLPFRLGGVIQSIHDKQTVGIRFLDVSERKREQVEQLIEEIREARERSEKAKGLEGSEAGVAPAG